MRIKLALLGLALAAATGAASHVAWFAPEAPPALPKAGGSAPAPMAPAAPDEPSHFVRGGALDTDCSHVGHDGAGYQFILTCPGKAVSPDGRWAVVQDKGEPGGIHVADAAGREIDSLPALRDAMPFVVIWSPAGDWFLANHYLGSGRDRLRLFQIAGGMVVERSAAFAEAAKVMVSRYPCLARGASISASGWKWSRDGRRVAMTVYARPDACHVEVRKGVWEPRGRWEVLWMIGDAASGAIDPASVRVREDGVGPMPKDGPYAEL